ncbi:DUF393 domain-containing protein [Cyanobium sp. AMD-g]|nr:DUF393 domain-containing protein [Cyanobium sp. AMD-g]
MSGLAEKRPRALRAVEPPPTAESRPGSTHPIPRPLTVPTPSALSGPSARSLDADQTLVLVYDGGCPFCRHFALSSELRSGIANLRIVDGRADRDLRRDLRARGLPLAKGAVLLQAQRAWHGADAVRHLCGLMHPSDPLLRLLVPLFSDPSRSERLYPLLLGARRLALALKGLPLDPDSP